MKYIYKILYGSVIQNNILKCESFMKFSSEEFLIYHNGWRTIVSYAFFAKNRFQKRFALFCKKGAFIDLEN